MNNLLSYCGLIDAGISASEKNLPVAWAFSAVFLSNSVLKALPKRRHSSFYKILCQLGVFMTIYIKCIILCCVCTIQSRPKLVDQNSPIAMLWAKYVNLNSAAFMVWILITFLKNSVLSDFSGIDNQNVKGAAGSFLIFLIRKITDEHQILQECDLNSDQKMS